MIYMLWLFEKITVPNTVIVCTMHEFASSIETHGGESHWRDSVVVLHVFNAVKYGPLVTCANRIH
jgi:hypothetical protein